VRGIGNAIAFVFENSSDPVWSPDGTTILFLDGVFDGSDIVEGMATMPPDGTARASRRSTAPAANTNPTGKRCQPPMTLYPQWASAATADPTRALLEGLCARLVERGEDSDLAAPLVYLARLECYAGNLARAAEDRPRRSPTRRAATASRRTPPRCEPSSTPTRAASSKRERRRRSQRARRPRPLAGGDVHCLIAVALLELSLGNHAVAMTALAPSIKLIEDRGVREALPLPEAIEALVKLGDVERAERLTDQLRSRAIALNRPASILAAARWRALVGAAEGDLEGSLGTLQRALAETPEVSVPLELARTLIVKGQLERRRKHKRHAQASLGRAVAICEHIGATLWAQRARSELDRLGRVRDPDELTATETRIAGLAASGLKQPRGRRRRVLLSRKTVEANISRIYRKLGIRSRAELGAWLAERESRPD
jgi:DNA-binding CsgD family transcriptional regulator